MEGSRQGSSCEPSLVKKKMRERPFFFVFLQKTRKLYRGGSRHPEELLAIRCIAFRLGAVEDAV
jgi:hypothetical protein